MAEDAAAHRLKKKLKKAVANQEFELAAKLRDELSRMEQTTLEGLKAEMIRAAAEEDFERAAQLRDEIQRRAKAELSSPPPAKSDPPKKPTEQKVRRKNENGEHKSRPSADAMDGADGGAPTSQVLTAADPGAAPSPAEGRTTMPFLTRYERSQVIAVRAMQISEGVRVPEGVGSHTNALDMAETEFEQGKIPFLIRRHLPNGDHEDWRMSDFIPSKW